MRIYIGSISLIGAERNYTFNKGLSIITGPIATGKTTLLRCIRGLIAGRFRNLSHEARHTISSIAGEIFIGEESYNIVRPFVTTSTAKVDIAGNFETLRLPALKPVTSSDNTYGRWLLEKLELPSLLVPRSPTKPDSGVSPVSINDYMMYCNLRQGEIDNSVFGHHNHYKDVKRKYVFQIVYGLYDIEIAQLEEQRREALLELRRLNAQRVTIEEFLSGTSFSNQALVEKELKDVNKSREDIENEIVENTLRIHVESDSIEVRSKLEDVENEISVLNVALQREYDSKVQMIQLLKQLETQSNRLTRSIVAESYLIDFDFLICPRCGSSLPESQDNDSICYLCHQQPELELSRDDLIHEQDRVERQILETRDLITSHEERATNISIERKKLSQDRESLIEEVNYLTKTFVSESASSIADSAGKRAELKERIRSLREYLELFHKLNESQTRVEKLQTLIDEIDVRIEVALGSGNEAEKKIQNLEERFREILDKFQVPEFVEHGYTGIDRATYLPRLQGRRFDELQSQGLMVLVNVAHAIAHQLTSIDFDLSLPNILLIDSLTGNIGYEGLDLERVEAVYRYLMHLHDEFEDRLQIIIADNNVPDFAKDFIKVQLSEDDKLIPVSLLI